ncbi:MAG: hypothetical protein WD845_15510 [Pirellulales bacterium]
MRTKVAQCRDDPAEIVNSLLAAVEGFAGGEAASDDRTVVAARVL